MNQAVITTKYIVQEKQPVLRVIHDNDGDWQFLGNQEVTEADAMVLSMAQMLQMDGTLAEVLDIPEGSAAIRTTVDSDWIIEPYDVL